MKVSNAEDEIYIFIPLNEVSDDVFKENVPYCCAIKELLLRFID